MTLDWSIAASVAAVVVPTAVALGKFLDMRLRLAISENNEELLKRINGAYVKKEVLEAKLESLDCHDCQYARRAS